MYALLIVFFLNDSIATQSIIGISLIPETYHLHAKGNDNTNLLISYLYFYFRNKNIHKQISKYR